MSYELDAFIGRMAELTKWKRELPSVVLIPLTEELGLVPLTAELGRALPAGPENWGKKASRTAIVALVTATYFGGAGSQSAVVWSEGKTVESGVDINQALRLLGVVAARGMDEFDTIDLGRYRKTERWAAVATVREIVNEADDPVAALVETLMRKPARPSRYVQMVRNRAVSVLGEFGPAAAKAVPALLRILRADDDYGLQIGAASALAAIGGGAVQALADLLEDRKVKDLWPILNALGEAGPAAAATVSTVASCLEHTDWSIRCEAARSLGRIGPAAGTVVPALVAALKDEDQSVRSAVAVALGEVGKRAQDAVPHLLKAISDEYPGLRKNSAKALAEIDCSVEEMVVPALITLLEDPMTEVVQQSAESLGEIGAKARAATGALIEALRHPNEYVRTCVCVPLAQIDPQSESVAQALIEATRDKSASVRGFAATALGTIGQEVEEVVPVLSEMLERREPATVIRHVVEALVSAGPAARVALPLLHQLIDHENPDVRETVAAALNRIAGP